MARCPCCGNRPEIDSPQDRWLRKWNRRSLILMGAAFALLIVGAVFWIVVGPEMIYPFTMTCAAMLIAINVLRMPAGANLDRPAPEDHAAP